MDSTDIPNEVFLAIFVEPAKLNRQIVKLIAEWNETLDPSFNMVKGQFKRFISLNPDYAQTLCHDVLKTLDALNQLKCPRNFLRGYLATIRSIVQGEESKAKQLIQDKIELYSSQWQKINVQVLESYFEAFSLKTKVPQQQIDQYISHMLETKKYNVCLQFIKFLGVGQNKENIERLMSKMSNKRDASKAADYVKRLNLDPKNYPQLGERLYKNTARHFLAKHGWEYTEEIFQEYPEALACVVEDLIYKNKLAEARSIWSRHPLWEYLQKEESKEFLKQEYQGELIPNTVISNNTFGPPDCQKYISLADFGITEQDVVWVDSGSHNLKQVLRNIQNADLLGIDTESIVGQTKFEKVGEAAIIQVSTGTKVYIFDGFRSSCPEIAEVFARCFREKKIIGHSFTNDTEGMFKGFGIPTAQQTQIKNLIDICKVYKGLNENTKYSSLAHICKQVLGKELCKDQTLTNWKRRPLRKNQVHYAALDAHVVVEIYRRWLEKYQEFIHYLAGTEVDQI